MVCSRTVDIDEWSWKYSWCEVSKMVRDETGILAGKMGVAEKSAGRVGLEVKLLSNNKVDLDQIIEARAQFC